MPLLFQTLCLQSLSDWARIHALNSRRSAIHGSACGIANTAIWTGALNTYMFSVFELFFPRQRARYRCELHVRFERRAQGTELSQYIILILLLRLFSLFYVFFAIVLIPKVSSTVDAEVEFNLKRVGRRNLFWDFKQPLRITILWHFHNPDSIHLRPFAP